MLYQALYLSSHGHNYTFMSGGFGKRLLIGISIHFSLESINRKFFPNSFI